VKNPAKILFCVFLFNAILFSPTLLAQDNCKISGIVKDFEKSSPVEADARLFTSDTVFVKGTKCDSSGAFVFDNLSYGTYKLEITMIDYAAITVGNIKLDESNPSESFDTLRLKKQNVTTEEILVEEQKGLINFSADKKIFNVDESMVTKGGTALDVLKKVPMVDVDINDNVSLRGSQNVRILIDDKPPKIGSLKQLPAEAIQKIELITNPSAKYESEGVTGIINIVTYKSDKFGFNGYTNFGGSYGDKYWGGLDLSLRKNKWTLFGGLYGGIYNYSFNYSGDIYYYSPVSSYLYDGSGTGRSRYLFFQGGAEYDAAKGSTFGIEASYNSSRYSSGYSSGNRYYDLNNIMTSAYGSKTDYDGLWGGNTFGVYYYGKYNELGRELSGNITYSGNQNDNDMNLFQQNYDSLWIPVNNTPLDQRDSTKMRTYNLNAQLDYTHPFNKDTKIEAGYKGTFNINDNDFGSDTLNYNSGTYENNTGVTNHFKLRENVYAAYGVFSKSIDKFSFKLGMRMEYTNTTGELLTGGSNFRKNYIDYFPTASVVQRIGDVHQLQLSYSRRITRPNVWRLNPFIRKSDPKFIYMGNPDLDPEFTDSYEISYMMYYNVISVTPTAFFRKSYDVISSYSYLIDSNVLVTTYRNASSSQAYGLDFVISSRTLSWLNLNGTASFYKTWFSQDAVTEYKNEEGFTWRANIRAFITLPSLFNLELYYNYSGTGINAQNKTIPSQNLDMGISKTFFKDKATVSLRVRDVFKTIQWGRNADVQGYRSSYRNDYDSREFSLNISYRFGNTEEYYQKKKKVKQNPNEKSDQGQDNSNMGR
jgi:outer membrane receptor protein involved in Fe transport